MADNVRELRPKAADSEKITINLGYVDLGHVDLLVQEGFYSNRTDFIRTAIRNQLERHAEAIYATIGKFCAIAANSRINALEHPIERLTQHKVSYRPNEYFRYLGVDQAFREKRRAKAVTIGHDVWIGHGATVLPGVTVGNGAVIGANFDRNIHGLRNDYAYDMTMARSIAVSTAAIEQASSQLPWAFRPLAYGLDVVGHEFTHGVIDSTAQLIYEGQSGALNEPRP